ncbi:oligopeptide/dipeptide ABC transporter ATP-binding protein [Martelella alba]|uniref:oligopeptide/dipeptide ABC transporter ATP-binding protein n=1 Tax=Martelella alba TaxID=2590451 RepID=UPI0035A36E4C
MALVLISHDLSVVGETCQRIAVVYAGRIVETAPAAGIFNTPAHPYTQGLLKATPRPQGRGRQLLPIPGQVPEPGNMPSGCAFAPRCPHARGQCGVISPGLLRVSHAHHHAACLLFASDSRSSVPHNPREPANDTA